MNWTELQSKQNLMLYIYKRLKPYKYTDPYLTMKEVRVRSPSRWNVKYPFFSRVLFIVVLYNTEALVFIVYAWVKSLQTHREDFLVRRDSTETPSPPCCKKCFCSLVDSKFFYFIFFGGGHLKGQKRGIPSFLPLYVTV